MQLVHDTVHGPSDQALPVALSHTLASPKDQHPSSPCGSPLTSFMASDSHYPRGWLFTLQLGPWLHEALHGFSGICRHGKG